MKLLVLGIGCAVWAYALPSVAQDAAAQQPSASPANPKPPPAATRSDVDVFLRSDPAGTEATFTAKPEVQAASGAHIPMCTAPCQTTLLPGTYKLELNHLPVENAVRLDRTSTLYGQVESHAQSRAMGVVALYLGGVLGGSLIGVAVLGAPNWTYAAGGGVLGTSAIIWLLTNRSDRAVVKLTLGLPPDSSTLPPNAVRDRERAGLSRQLSAGFGIRTEF